MTATSGWALDLVDEELEIPGWFLVPSDLVGDGADAWVDTVARYARDFTAWDHEVLAEDTIREIARAGLDARARSDSLAVLQVWPALANVTAMCHVDVVLSDPTLDWTQTDATVHRVQEPHLGPGLQISTRRTVELDGVEMEVSSMTFAFDDGEVTLLFSLTETLTPLVTLSLSGFLALMRNVRLVSTPGDEPFVAVEPRGTLADSWDLEGTA